MRERATPTARRRVEDGLEHRDKASKARRTNPIPGPENRHQTHTQKHLTPIGFVSGRRERSQSAGSPPQSDGTTGGAQAGRSQSPTLSCKGGWYILEPEVGLHTSTRDAA